MTENYTYNSYNDTRLDRMLEKISDPDWHVRHAAADQLAYIHDPAAEQALVRALDDSSPAVRWAAMRSLSFCGRHELEPMLRALTEQLDNLQLQHGARRVLKNYLRHNPDDRVMRSVLNALQGPVPGLAAAWAAHRALQHLHS